MQARACWFVVLALAAHAAAAPARPAMGAAQAAAEREALAALATTDDDTTGVGEHHRLATTKPRGPSTARGSAASEKVVPRPVGANYPHISSVSSFLAAKYEKEHLTKASLAATDFVMVAALAVQTSADIVSRQEARMPFGGFALPVEQQRYRKGRLYILCGLVEVSWAAAAQRKVNPWPEWHMLCGKVFRDEQNGKKYAIRLVVPPRLAEKLTDARTAAVVGAAVAGLAQLPRYQQRSPSLAAVLSVERQTMDQFSFAKLALSTIPGDIDLYYVAFLTSDAARRDAPPVPHIAAVMRSAKTGIKVVRQVSFGEPGYTILRGEAGVQHMSVFEFNGKAQREFQAALAKAIGHGLEPEDVVVTGVDVLHGGAVGVARADHSAAAQDRRRLAAQSDGAEGGASGHGARSAASVTGSSVALGGRSVVVSADRGYRPASSSGSAGGGCAAGYSADSAAFFVADAEAEGEGREEEQQGREAKEEVMAEMEGSVDAAAAAARAAVLAEERRRRRLGGGGGVQVSYTLSVQGGATAVLRELRKTSFASTLAAAMVAAGVAGVSGSDVTVTSRVYISNDELAAPAGLSLNQLLVLLSAFVLGVLLTTVRAAQLRARERRLASGGA